MKKNLSTRSKLRTATMKRNKEYSYMVMSAPSEMKHQAIMSDVNRLRKRLGFKPLTEVDFTGVGVTQ